MGGIFSHPATQAVTQCNGNAALCNRLYSNVTHVGAHDSAFVGVLPTQNQLTDVTSQLNMGIRFLQGQVHNKNGAIELCHTTCAEEDAGTLQNYLSSVKTWLDHNEDQVLTLLLVNGDGQPVSQFGDVFASAGLNSYAYTPPHTLKPNEWPTLQTLIDNGDRLVVFLDTGANTQTVPYILDEFSYFFETPYDTTDENFPECSIDRPAGLKDDGRMFIVNHFLDYNIFNTGILVPYEAKAPQTNSKASILAQSNICVQNYGRNPNFVLLDYVSMGSPLDAQNALNGV